jgi:hypothetical protein
MKLSVTSGRVRESLTHWPGLGSGTSLPLTGSQLAFIEFCSCLFVCLFSGGKIGEKKRKEKKEKNKQ